MTAGAIFRALPFHITDRLADAGGAEEGDMRSFICLAAMGAVLWGTVGHAHAQSSTGDAREVALGGVDYAGRILADSAGPQSPGFVVPL